MRFAFKTSPQDTTWADMLAVWQAADDIEIFESGWNFDHFYPIFSDSTGPCLEAWTLLAALAQATTRLRLGALVTGAHYRHPAVLANMAATVDIISDGRLEIGIGAGWNEEESGAYGIALGTPGERSDRFEEACEVLVALLSQDQETSSFSGQYFTLTDARCNPKPLQRPHPPICIGGSGERRTLRTAARFAQHWNFVGGPVEEFARKRDVLHQHCADIGRDPTEILLSSHVRHEGDPSATADVAAALGEEGLGLAIVYLPPPHTPAVLEPLAAALAKVG
jgi:F420-dependent oxidoreductase-like protein